MSDTLIEIQTRVLAAEQARKDYALLLAKFQAACMQGDFALAEEIQSQAHVAMDRFFDNLALAHRTAKEG